MKTMKSLVLAAVLLFATSHADAFYLNLNNEGLTGGPWGEVTLTDATYTGLDAVFFKVDPFAAAFDGVSGNFGLQTFLFNESTGRANLLGDIQVVQTNPTGWDMTYSASSNLGGTGPYGKFEFQYKGTGGTRADPLEFYLTTSAFDIQASQFAVTSPNTNFMFEAHIAGFIVDGDEDLSSAQFATGNPVPEPGTIMLLGAGFLGLAIYSKRRRNV